MDINIHHTNSHNLNITRREGEWGLRTQTWLQFRRGDSASQVSVRRSPRLRGRTVRPGPTAPAGSAPTGTVRVRVRARVRIGVRVRVRIGVRVRIRVRVLVKY